MNPIFSICHTTARPHDWKKSYDAWWSNAVDKKSVEYVLCFDERWGFTAADVPPRDGAETRVIWNTGRKCSVDGWNLAAAEAKGKVLILNADDFLPPRDWDQGLLRAIPSMDSDFVVEVTSNSHATEQRLMVLGILSRARYARLGYALHPGYESVFSDNEFTEHARKDGVVIDARHLEFHHYHPMSQEGQWDPVYAHQNENRCYVEGAALLNRRRAAGFPA